MFVADLEQGRIISDDELKKDLCNKQDYQSWLNETMVYLEDLKPEDGYRFKRPERETLFKNQQIFGYTYEDIIEIIVKYTGDAIHK